MTTSYKIGVILVIFDIKSQIGRIHDCRLMKRLAYLLDMY